MIREGKGQRGVGGVKAILEKFQIIRFGVGIRPQSPAPSYAFLIHFPQHIRRVKPGGK